MAPPITRIEIVSAVTVAMRSSGQTIDAMIWLGMMTAPTPRHARQTGMKMRSEPTWAEAIAPLPAVMMQLAMTMTRRTLPLSAQMRTDTRIAPMMMPKLGRVLGEGLAEKDAE